MIGDAYFQLRAQVGTAVFSLLRLADEAGTGDGALTALRPVQAELREPFLFLALGPQGSGKSELLNAFFEREFCGPAEPATAGLTAIYQYGEEAGEVKVSPRVVTCQRTHIFLRDFTIVDAAGLVPPAQEVLEDIAPFLPKADLILFTAPAVGATADIWEFLLRLGRDALRRTVFVVSQSDRITAEEGAMAVKRLRQAMLKNLGHACPIFGASARDRSGREKLLRWIETEIIFSPRRRALLSDIDRVAQEALREIAGQPQATERAWQQKATQLHAAKEDLAEREEQSQRQIAGALWSLAQGFDSVRERGETLLIPHLGFRTMRQGGGEWVREFASEFEAQARESLVAQMKSAMTSLESDLIDDFKEFRALSKNILSGDIEPVSFPRKEIGSAVKAAETPLELQRTLSSAISRATSCFRLPALGAIGALAVLLGAWPVVGFVPAIAVLATGSVALVSILVFLLRRNILAEFGRHFSANRAALITAAEGPLREASARFYAPLSGPLDARIAAHETERQQHEPLFTKVETLRQTFAKIAEDLRAGRSSGSDADMGASEVKSGQVEN